MENILMWAVKKGKDRQIVHERLRTLSIEAKQACKLDALLEWIAQGPSIGIGKEELDELLNLQHFIGRAPAQVREFLNTTVNPLLAKLCL